MAGAYAGRARFCPVDVETLPVVLRGAVGRIVKVAYAGMGQAGDPFTGQALYLEWTSDEVFDGFLIPEQDLEFLGG
jgi:hypothetical protein